MYIMGDASAGIPVKVYFPVFRERVPWFGGDLQTLRNFVARRAGYGPGNVDGDRLLLSLSDGGRLASCLTPGEVGRPRVVLIHGLTGCETAANMVVAARHLNCLGFPVLRINLRDSNPSAATTEGHYHAGRTEDLRDALSALASEVTAEGLLLMGFSLGGNMMLKFLAETGRDFPVRAAVAVSTPIDLAESAIRLMRRRNAFYHGWLLKRMKAQWAMPPLKDALARALREARSILEFDDGVVSRINGFEGAREYYQRNGALAFLSDIPVPTLLIHARNDPWIGSEPYEHFDWRSNRNLVLLMSNGGGHVGFHGSAGPTPWHCLCAGRFFEGIIGEC